MRPLEHITINLNHNEEFHLLVGEALDNEYSHFREEVLKIAKWSKNKIESPKGWLIYKEDLEDAIERYSIPYIIIN